MRCKDCKDYEALGIRVGYCNNHASEVSEDEFCSRYSESAGKRLGNAALKLSESLRTSFGR